MTVKMRLAGSTFLTFATLGLVPAIHAQSLTTIATSRQVRGESDLTVNVRFGVGDFALGRDGGRSLYRASLVFDAEKFEPVHRYRSDTRTFEFGVGIADGPRFRNIKVTGQRAELRLNPRVPTAIDLEFGAGRATVDLGGLNVTRAKIKTGASESELEFSRPTVAPCGELSVEVGAAQFVAKGLGNSNCESFALKGAAGSVTLDFTGEWQHRGVTTGSVTLGLGGLALVFPSHLGVSISISRFLASFDDSGFEKRGDRYFSRNYDDAPSKLDLRIEAVVGDVDVVWVP